MEYESLIKGTEGLLFTGKNQYSLFMKILWKVMNQNKRGFWNMGLDVVDLD